LITFCDFIQIVNDSLIQRYPPSKKYLSSFLKSYVEQLENHNQEIHEELLTVCMDLLKTSEENDIDCYKSYHYLYEGSPLVVTLRVRNQFNLVGLTTWEAGFFLSEYIIENRSDIEGLEILELGAGVGLSSIISARCGAKHVIASDYNDQILDNLSHNLTINGINVIKNGSIEENGNASIVKLDWNLVTLDSIIQFDSVDVIIAADVIYDYGLINSFVRLIRLLLERRERKILIATTRRNSTTFSFYLNQLKRENIQFMEIESINSLPHLFRYNNRENVILHQLKLIVQ